MAFKYELGRVWEEETAIYSETASQYFHERYKISRRDQYRLSIFLEANMRYDFLRWNLTKPENVLGIL